MIRSVFYFFLLLGMQAFSQLDNRDFEDFIEEHHLLSEHTGRNYILKVSLPKSYHDETERNYPVLFALDGNYSLPLLNSIRQFQEIGGELEELIIIGIEHKSERTGLMKYRIPDFTPSPDPAYEEKFSKIRNIPRDELTSGEAERFLKSLTDEILPLVEENYRTSARKGIVGHSLAGLFTAYIVINRPETFDYYAMLSPILNWNSNKYISNIELDLKKIEDKTLFLAAGEREERILPAFQQFIDSLELENAGHRIYANVLRGEKHFSLVGTGFSRALNLFAGKDRLKEEDYRNLSGDG